MRVQVRFFALLREKSKTAEATWEIAAGATVAELWASLVTAFPAIEPLSGSVSFAVNQEYVDRNARLNDGDEVALIPPVSGG